MLTQESSWEQLPGGQLLTDDEDASQHGTEKQQLTLVLMCLAHHV
jgi:hypothetical protein